MTHNTAITDCSPCRSLVTVLDRSWRPPASIVACVGATREITHEEWCKREAKRINATGGHAEVTYVTKRLSGNQQPTRHCHVSRRSDEVLEVEPEQ